MPEDQPRTSSHRFFSVSAIIIAGLIVLSFPFTYFMPLATGSKSFTLLRHLHGLVFFGWTGLFVWQSWLVQRGRMRLHRELGLLGAALVGAMVPLGLWLAVVAIGDRMAKGNPLPFEFSIYNLLDIAAFALLIGFAIQQATRRIEWHRRLVYVAMLSLLGPAASRWFLLIPLPWPYPDMTPNLFADLFLFPLAFHDRKVLGKIHPATLWAGAVFVPLHIAEPFIGRSDWWNAIAPALFGFG